MGKPVFKFEQEEDSRKIIIQFIEELKENSELITMKFIYVVLVRVQL